MINIGDNLGYKGIKPNFDRDSFSTISSMIAISDNNIDDGHISYCQETNKHYKFNRSNTIDQTLGKWRLFFSGQLGQSEDIGVNQKIVTDTVNALTSSIALKQNKLITGSGIQISDQDVISATVSSYTYAGTVSTVSNLPTTSTIGYFYCVTNDVIANTNYAWNGSSWQSIGNSLYSLATESKSGLMPYTDKSKIDLLQNIDKPQFSLIDSNGNIGMKYDENGLDVALLSTHFQGLIDSLISVLITSSRGTTLAPLVNSLIPATYLPSYVDDVIDIDLFGTTAISQYCSDNDGNTNNLPDKFCYDDENKVFVTAYQTNNAIDLISAGSPESGKIYLDINANVSYRWSGTTMVEISNSISLGETAATAYAGDKGKLNSDNITTIKNQINIIQLYIQQIQAALTQTDEYQFSVADTNGNIGLKYNQNGFDVALLSDHFKNILKQIDGIGLTLGTIPGTAYDGGSGKTLENSLKSLESSIGNLQYFVAIDELQFSVCDSNGYSIFNVGANGINFKNITTNAITVLKNAGVGTLSYNVIETIN